jgi:hypothetical protein
MDQEQREKWRLKTPWKPDAVDREREYYQRWSSLRFSRRNFLEKPLAQVLEAVRQPTKAHGPTFVAAATGLAWWYQHEGIRRILEGDPAGWADLNGAWHLVALLLHLEHRFDSPQVCKFLGFCLPKEGFPSGSRTLYHNAHYQANNALWGLVALGQVQMLQPLARHLYDVSLHFQQTVDPLPVFLADRLTGSTLPTDPPLRVPIYRHSHAVMEAWEQDSDFEEVIWERIRIGREVGLDGGMIPTTDSRYFPTAFTHIAAIQRVRRHEGRPCALPQHPILQSPLYQVPDRVEHPLPPWYAPVAEMMGHLWEDKEGTVPCP